MSVNGILVLLQLMSLFLTEVTVRVVHQWLVITRSIAYISHDVVVEQERKNKRTDVEKQEKEPVKI